MTAEQRKAIARRYFEDLVSEGNLAATDEILPEQVMTKGGPSSRETFNQLVTLPRSAFPDAPSGRVCGRISSQEQALMPADLTVRVAGQEDMPALMRLFRGFMDYLGDPSPPDDELAAAITPVFADPNAEILIGEIGGEPVSYAHVRYHHSVWTAGPESFLEDLFVFEDRRDGGIGRQMLGVVFDRARARGCRRVRLDTNEENKRGIHLYESAGFACTRDSYDGGRQLYYTAYLDE